MLRNGLLSIVAGFAFLAGGCGGGGGDDNKQQDAGQHDVVQFDTNQGQDDAAPDGPVGNHTFETAKSITLDGANYTNGTLSNPLTSKDYYKFEGTAGQRIAIATIAKGEQTDTFDPAYLDLVVTLYNSSQTAIASQDDPWPRASNDPQLFTVLPSAGTYYIEVVECNLAYGSASCSSPAEITNKAYQVAVFTVDNLGPPFPALEGATDQDGTTANAIVVPFNSAQTVDAGVGGNFYYQNVLGGAFSSGTDIDVYSVKYPADYLINDSTYRATSTFYLQVPGAASGNGSTAEMKVWLVDANDSSGKYVAMIDQANYGVDFSGTNGPAELTVPVTFNNQYYLFVQNGGTAGAQDFYFITRADDDYFGPTETADSTNTTLGTPEAMATQKDVGDGSDWYGVSGNLAAGDVDHYSFATNTGLTSINVRCDAMRIGSGLRGFKATLLKTDGTAVANGSATETADADLFLEQVPVPAGVTQLILKVEATSAQDANLTSDHYRCQIHVFTPTA